MKKTIFKTMIFIMTFISVFTISYFASAEESTDEEIVVDTEAPKVFGTIEYTTSNKTQLSIEAIKSSLVVNDNIDSDPKLILQEENYSLNWQKPGTYYVTFRAEDDSGNYSLTAVKIYVVDKISPVFYSKDGQAINEYTIYKSIDSVFLLSDVKEMFFVVDDVDGDITDLTILEDTYTGNGDEVGCYQIVLSAKDKAGNITDFIVNINVSKLMPEKTLVIDNRIIIVENNRQLSNNDFSNILKTCGYYNTNTTTYIDIDSVSYQELYNINGEYLVEYELSTTSGTTSSGSLTVRVCDSRNTENTIISEAANFFEVTFNWFKNIIQSIGNFFSKVFKK